VPISAPYSLTECRRFFAQPATARQRQYEALRAFYRDGLRSSEVARRFGYTAGAFRVLCRDFRRHALPELFAATRSGRRAQPKKSRAHDQIVALRKRNYSVYEISQGLKEQGVVLSATAVREVLAAEGFAPLPRRLDEERPARIGPHAQAVANVGCWSEKGDSDSVLGMSKRFRPWKIDEPLLLPPPVQDFVVEDHLARFVLSLVRDEIDLAAITASCKANAGSRRSIPS
jgi:transposase